MSSQFHCLNTVKETFWTHSKMFFYKVRKLLLLRKILKFSFDEVFVFIWQPSSYLQVTTLPVCPCKPEAPRLSTKMKQEPTSLNIEWGSCSFHPVNTLILRPFVFRFFPFTFLLRPFYAPLLSLKSGTVYGYFDTRFIVIYMFTYIITFCI